MFTLHVLCIWLSVEQNPSKSHSMYCGYFSLCNPSDYRSIQYTCMVYSNCIFCALSNRNVMCLQEWPYLAIVWICADSPPKVVVCTTKKTVDNRFVYSVRMVLLWNWLMKSYVYRMCQPITYMHTNFHPFSLFIQALELSAQPILVTPPKFTRPMLRSLRLMMTISRL